MTPTPTPLPFVLDGAISYGHAFGIVIVIGIITLVLIGGLMIIVTLLERK